MSTKIWRNTKNRREYAITLVDSSGNDLGKKPNNFRFVAEISGHLVNLGIYQNSFNHAIYEKEGLIKLLLQRQKELEEIKSKL